MMLKVGLNGKDFALNLNVLKDNLCTNVVLFFCMEVTGLLLFVFSVHIAYATYVSKWSVTFLFFELWQLSCLEHSTNNAKVNPYKARSLKSWIHWSSWVPSTSEYSVIEKFPKCQIAKLFYQAWSFQANIYSYIQILLKWMKQNQKSHLKDIFH